MTTDRDDQGYDNNFSFVSSVWIDCESTYRYLVHKEIKHCLTESSFAFYFSFPRIDSERLNCQECDVTTAAAAAAAVLIDSLIHFPSCLNERILSVAGVTGTEKRKSNDEVAGRS